MTNLMINKQNYQKKSRMHIMHY